jgi:hypothetical protein
MRKLGIRLAILAVAATCVPACSDDDDDSSSSSSSAGDIANAFGWMFYLMFGGMMSKPAGATDDVLPQVSVGTVTAEGTSARVQGTASDDVAVAEVAWLNETTGETCRADGTTAWTASIPLAEGTNLISVGVRDGANNMNLVSFILERRGDSVYRVD